MNKIRDFNSDIAEIYGVSNHTTNGISDNQKATPVLIDQIDLFKRNESTAWDTGIHVGRVFRLSFTSMDVLLMDAWKEQAGGVPQGAFLLAYYDNTENNTTVEAILLRVIEPTSLPQDNENIISMVEYYKDNIKNSQLDPITRHHYSASGLKCSILGCFYKDTDGKTKFGADLENFYSAHNYSVIKPFPHILKYIVNYKEEDTSIGKNDIKIGKVRYSSSQRFQSSEPDVPVYVQADDFAGKRTALFGMTRTGKSNTTKKIIQATVEMSKRANVKLSKLIEKGTPKYPLGQIIFDINGEYANSNIQDGGTAIFEIYKEETVRYSTVEEKTKNGFKVMKVNFYTEIEEGFSLIKTHLSKDEARFVANFRNVSLDKPEDYDTNHSEKTRYDRKISVYQCCLYLASFTPPKDFKVKFRASEEVRKIIDPNINPDDQGIISLGLDSAINWWKKLWDIYKTEKIFSDYNEENNKEWADDDLKALLAILTRKTTDGSKCAGFRILKGVVPQHSEANENPFDEDILKQLRDGKIVIVDLSSGEEEIQRMFSKRITEKIFNDALLRFTENKENNFIQFYFEEAHNLFPKQEDTDLSQIYNRLAKEGAKLNLGLIYATQEVSSISNNILKATQNWFISHLNNHDEINELKKYYDFKDFAESLIRFSQNTDKGFVRMKTYSNPFIVPVQIDRFHAINTSKQNRE